MSEPELPANPPTDQPEIAAAVDAMDERTGMGTDPDGGDDEASGGESPSEEKSANPANTEGTAPTG